MNKPDEPDEYIDGLINNELNNLVTNTIGPYTCQFLKQNSGDDLSPFASGVMVEIDKMYYILTASHVVEDWSDSNKLFLEVNGSYVSIVGKGCGTAIEKKDRIDIACIKLKEEIMPLLKPWYKFLKPDRFLHHDKLLLEADYCVYGFPVSNYRRENGKIKTVAAAYFVRPHQDKVFENYSLDPLTHYVLEIKGKGVNIKTGVAEKIKMEPYGLSGGGLWYTTIEYNGKRFISNAYLIGIMTEFRKGKYECLIANRLELLLQALNRNKE